MVVSSFFTQVKSEEKPSVKRLLFFLPVPSLLILPSPIQFHRPSGNEAQTLELKGGWQLGAWRTAESWVTPGFLRAGKCTRKVPLGG